MKTVCFLCDGELVFEEWYGKCERCHILKPESKERTLQEIDGILTLRMGLNEHLHDIEQKQISSPETMTERDKEERDLWTEHNNLYDELKVFMDQYDIKNICFHEIYPRLYSYVKIANKIKRIYQ